MKALSLTRPWTELILAGIKDVENRSWSTPFRGTLVVHGAKSWDDAALRLLDELGGDGMLTTDDFDQLDTCQMHPGAPVGYLGFVTVTDCHRWDDLTCRSEEDSDRCSPWAFEGSYHWRVSQAHRFTQPIAGPGRLGLWTPPTEVITVARELVAS